MHTHTHTHKVLQLHAREEDMLEQVENADEERGAAGKVLQFGGTKCYNFSSEEGIVSKLHLMNKLLQSPPSHLLFDSDLTMNHELIGRAHASYLPPKASQFATEKRRVSHARVKQKVCVHISHSKTEIRFIYSTIAPLPLLVWSEEDRVTIAHVPVLCDWAANYKAESVLMLGLGACGVFRTQVRC